MIVDIALGVFLAEVAFSLARSILTKLNERHEKCSMCGNQIAMMRESFCDGCIVIVQEGRLSEARGK